MSNPPSCDIQWLDLEFKFLQDPCTLQRSVIIKRIDNNPLIRQTAVILRQLWSSKNQTWQPATLQFLDVFFWGDSLFWQEQAPIRLPQLTREFNSFWSNPRKWLEETSLSTKRSRIARNQAIVLCRVRRRPKSTHPGSGTHS